MPAPRILLSEGSSLSAREAVTALGLAGYRVELVSSDPLCLGRFSRFVDRVHPAPSSGADPDGYLDAVLDVVARSSIDVLLPVHEQAYLFAAARQRLPAGLGIALSEFTAFEQVQSKTALTSFLSRIGVPQPATEIVTSAREFASERAFPYFVKGAFGTASSGVRRIDEAIQRDALSRELQQRGAFAEGVVVQAAANGPLERLQAVFDHGRLVAIHIYRQVAVGPGGGDVLKISVRRPAARTCVETIGAALNWHGALSFDYILDAAAGVPLFFDANPRLVEPMNAWFSGVDLAGALLKISLGEKPQSQPDGTEGVITRLGLMGLMDAANQRGRRSDVVRELILQARGAGRYRGSIEELVPLARDPYCIVPLAVVLAKLLVSPAASEQLSRHTIDTYSLSPLAIKRLHEWV
jgi:predicted ATP-grasp superfamily ATP-dependent carboligase